MHHPWRRLRNEHPDWVVDWCFLPDRLAVTVWETRTIHIDRRMSQAQRRSTICHELFHIERGPVSDDPLAIAHEETMVEALAARALIGLHELGEALAWSSWPHEIAAELWVDEALLAARIAGLHPAEHAYLTRRLEGEESIR